MSNKSYITTVEDAGDGSGDVMLTIPDEILQEMSWGEGTLLDLSTETIDGKVVLILKLSPNNNKVIDKA